MQVKITDNKSTQVTFSAVADKELLDKHLKIVLNQFSKTMSLPGFRKGHIPTAILEKNIDPSTLQTEFLDSALNDMYSQSIKELKLMPVDRPNVSVKKFVPFETLEVVFDVERVADIVLPDIKKLTTRKKKTVASEKDVKKVVDDLIARESTRQESKLAAKLNDEVVFDFEGSDEKTKQVIEGAKADNYPLVLGSKSFIPGFEEELIGLKKGDQKEFKITFPADYYQTELKSKKTVFKVKIKSVNKLVKPELDEKFFAKIGPFKNLEDLKKAVSQQLESEDNNRNKQNFDNQIVEELVEKTKIDLPESLIKSELDRILEQDKAALQSRGQTFEDHLKEEGVTEEEHTKRNREMAEKQIKAGLVLSKLASDLGITVTETELKARLNLLTNYYQTDEYMLKELETENAKLDIKNRMQIEKTLDYLDNLLNK